MELFALNDTVFVKFFSHIYIIWWMPFVCDIIDVKTVTLLWYRAYTGFFLSLRIPRFKKSKK